MPKKSLAFILAFMLLFSANAAYALSFNTEVESGVKFRNSPSIYSYVYRTLPKGENIHVVEKINSYWLKIIVQDGTMGYISADPVYTNYSGVQAPSIPYWEMKADAVIATAKSLIGRVDYQLGARDPSRLIFDCSSFTQYVFGKHGISLSWGTKYQKYAGSYVSKGNLRKGDLLFFSANSYSINHVGIYIGNDRFIHNAPSGNVHISDLDGFWDNNYETARRVI